MIDQYVAGSCTVSRFGFGVGGALFLDGGIIDGMDVVQDATNPLKWNISSGTYFVGGQPYTYVGGSVTLAVGPSAATSPGRADLIIATSAGVTTIQGSANSTTPKTAGFQESSQLPLAVIIVAAGATSTSNPNLITRSNMNFGGRMSASASAPSHSFNGYNGSNSKMSINIANQGYMDSQYSYIFGGTNNKLSGTTYLTAAQTHPNNGIVGGKDNVLNGSASVNSGIFGSDAVTMTDAAFSNVVGCKTTTIISPLQSIFLNCSRSHFTSQINSTFISTLFCTGYTNTGYTNTGTGNLMLNCDYSTISQGVQDSGMLLTSYSYMSGMSSNSGIFAGRDSRVDTSDYSVMLGGSYNFINNSTAAVVTGSENSASTSTLAFISGVKNRIANSVYSTIIGGSGNTITSQGSSIFNSLNTNLSNIIGQVAIACNTYSDAGLTLPSYILTTDNLKINKELIYGINDFKSGTTLANSEIVQACDPVGGGSATIINLPSAPYDGQVKICKDATGAANVGNVITVKGNGHNIDGAAVK